MNTELTIIIPLYNEEDRIGNLARLYTFLRTFPHKVEVLLVNDGSTDRTAQKLTKAVKQYGFRIISYAENHGKGFALRQGVKEARGAYILLTDIDLSVPITFLDRFWHIRQKADIVIATRRHPESRIFLHQSALREVSGWGFTALTRVWLGIDASDVTCGFKLFEKSAAQAIFLKSIINRFAFDAEVLFLAKRMGFTIHEEPVDWENDRRSTVVFPRDVVISFVDLLRVRLNHTLM